MKTMHFYKAQTSLFFNKNLSSHSGGLTEQFGTNLKKKEECRIDHNIGPDKEILFA